MRASCVLAAAGLCGMAVTEAFVFIPAAASTASRWASRRQQTQEVASVVDVGGSMATEGASDSKAENEKDETKGAWDMMRWPSKSKKFAKMPEEAKNWEVEDERAEVWEDKPNPVEELAGGDWIETFTPSDEEISAAAMGFDWTDEWFERNGKVRKDLMTAGELEIFEKMEKGFAEAEEVAKSDGPAALKMAHAEFRKYQEISKKLEEAGEMDDEAALEIVNGELRKYEEAEQKAEKLGEAAALNEYRKYQEIITKIGEAEELDDEAATELVVEEWRKYEEAEQKA